FARRGDDFEVNWMVDRNLQVSYLIVDEMHHDHPELLKDQYWDEVFPNELPYTIAAERFRENHPEPSTAKIEVPKNAAMPSTMSSVRIDEMADDASGIHFSAGNGKMRLDSSPSLVSVSGTLSRVNTVASALKRFLSRDDSRPGSATPSQDQPYKFPASASSASLSAAVVGSATSAGKPAGSLRITQQVIEEVDEQATITSMRANEPRPNVMDIFAQTSSGAGTSGPLQPPPAHSEPVDIPSRPPSYNRAQSQYEPNLYPPGGVDALLSTSAPAGGSPLLLSNAATAPSSPVGESSKSLYDPQKGASRETVENMDLRSSTDLLGNAAVQPEDEGDDFDKLRAEREKEKLMRQQKNLARTISTAPGMEATAVPMVPMVPVNVAVQQAQLQPVASSADLLAGGDQFSNSTMKSEDAINGS
ncbi:GD20729, partial [Drosophila simulans]